MYGNTLEWLLEPENPGVRYLALKDLMDLSSDDPELIAARELAHKQGSISSILDAMEPDGYWVKPGPGYNPKYRGTVWAVMFLAQLGASVVIDQRIKQACEYLLSNNLRTHGLFTFNGVPSGTLDCLQGNLCAAMLDLGCDDPRLEEAFEWMARSVTGEGIVPYNMTPEKTHCVIMPRIAGRSLPVGRTTINPVPGLVLVSGWHKVGFKIQGPNIFLNYIPILNITSNQT